MRKYLINIGLQGQVVILGVVVLAGLIFGSALMYFWIKGIRNAEQYRTAPKCSDARPTGCRREMDAVVSGIRYESTGGRTKSHTYYVDILMPDGSKTNWPLLESQDHDLYKLLRPGYRVQAEWWQGYIVGMRGANGASLRTQYDPEYVAPHTLVGAILAFAVTALAAFFLFMQIRKL
jgi:hypothetical protein